MDEKKQRNLWKIDMEDGIYWIRLDRPRKKNAFNPKVLEELAEILRASADNEEIRVIAISSTNDDFTSAGADIEWFYDVDGEHGVEISKEVQKVFGLLEKLPFPVIFATKGLNLTAGFELMLASDIVIAADNSKLGQIETKWALTPGGGGTQRLVRHVGILKAKEIILTAKIFDAAEALEIGLVNYVVPLNKLDDKVREIAAQIMKRTPGAIKDAKYLLNMAYYPSTDGFKEEQIIFGKRFESGEPRSAFNSFIKKIKDPEKGRE